MNALERIINAGFAKEQMISCGYTEEEFAEAESIRRNANESNSSN